MSAKEVSDLQVNVGIYFVLNMVSNQMGKQEPHHAVITTINFILKNQQASLYLELCMLI